MTITEFLIWLSASGGAVIAFSWIAEQFDGWHALSKKEKQLYSFAGSVVIALAAWAVLSFAPPDVLSAIAEPFAVVSGVFVLVFLKDGYHAVTKYKE